VAVTLTAAVAISCVNENSRDAAAVPTNRPGKTAAQTAVEGFTGKTAVDAGRKAEATIRQISAEHNRDLNEAMRE